jgi:hypothetical protein
MFAVLEEARTLVFAEKLDYGRRIGRVVRWPSFERLKGRLRLESLRQSEARVCGLRPREGSLARSPYIRYQRF